MPITITEQEYQELMRIKQEHEAAKVKLNEFLNKLSEYEKNTQSNIVILNIEALRKEFEELLK